MLRPDLTTEKVLWSKGLSTIVGIDEVGRGSWAGPLVAAGVVLPQNFRLPKKLNDSKKITKSVREDLSEYIKTHAAQWYIDKITQNQLDRLGITEATQQLFKKIIDSFKPEIDFALIDGFPLKSWSKSKQKAIIKGDQISASIAAASIIAKVYRDNLMDQESTKYPEYGFKNHKGYGTKQHQQAIQNFGFCQIHRTSFNLKFLFS